MSVIEGLYKNEQIDVPHMNLGTGIGCDLLLSPRRCLFKETSTKISPMNMPGHVFIGLELKACSMVLPSIHFQTHGYQAIRSASNVVLATFFHTNKKAAGSVLLPTWRFQQINTHLFAGVSLEETCERWGGVWLTDLSHLPSAMWWLCNHTRDPWRLSKMPMKLVECAFEMYILGITATSTKKDHRQRVFEWAPVGSGEEAPQMLTPLPWDESQLQGGHVTLVLKHEIDI